MSAALKLTALVVTYNSADVLVPLLDSLAESTGFPLDVLVVDNASQDRSTELAAGHRLAPRVVQTGRNGGFAAAVNMGLAEIAPDRAVLILNPDIRLRPGAVAALMRRLQEGAGIVVPQLLHPDGGIHHSIRREPSLLTAWSEALLGGDRAARLGLGEIVADPGTYRRVERIDCASGAALLVSPAVRQGVGAWDESYFLYSEEVDYMRRVRRSGFEIVYEPASVAVHVGGESNRDPALFSLLTVNRIRYYRRSHGPAATLLFRLAVATGLILRLGRGRVYRPALFSAVTLSLGRFRPRFPELSR